MIRVLIILTGIVLLFSCKQSSAPDVSYIPAEFDIYRTEKDIRSIHSREDFDKLYDEHPAFYNLFFNEVTGMYTGNDKDTMYTVLQHFLQDSMMIAVNEKIDKKYNDLSDVKKDLQSFFRYLQYYFPDNIEVPNIYTLVSDFGHQIFLFVDENNRDGIGLGLDMFLSPDIPYKMMFPDNTNFSDYLTRSWSKDYIVKKVADLYVNEIIGESPGHRLLDYMIYNGKVLYITGLLLPEKNDTIIHEYTGQEMDWCYENELQMWSFFLDQKLFYESNFSKIGKYVFPSPISPDMPEAAPGRTANFIGWQIIKAYMNRFPETTLKQLIDMEDSQLLLEKSKYKPKKK